MVKKITKKGKLADLACRHLSPDDCLKHPNCQWVKEYITKGGVARRAHCGSKARPIKLTAPSQKRKTSGVSAAAKNPWIEHARSVAQERGISYREALKVAGASYQKGGNIDSLMKKIEPCLIKGFRNYLREVTSMSEEDIIPMEVGDIEPMEE